MASGCTVTPTAGTGRSGTWPQLVPSPRATETWALAPSLGPLNPDSEGGGARSHQVPPTSGQAVPRLQDQVPTAARGPPSPAQAMLRHQEAQHLLLGAGPLCSRVCPNKTQVGKPETKKDPGEGGTFKIAVDQDMEIVCLPTNTSKIHLHVEQFLQITYWTLAEDSRLQKNKKTQWKGYFTAMFIISKYEWLNLNIKSESHS